MKKVNTWMLAATVAEETVVLEIELNEDFAFLGGNPKGPVPYPAPHKVNAFAVYDVGNGGLALQYEGKGAWASMRGDWSFDGTNQTTYNIGFMAPGNLGYGTWITWPPSSWETFTVIPNIDGYVLFSPVFNRWVRIAKFDQLPSPSWGLYGDEDAGNAALIYLKGLERPVPFDLAEIFKSLRDVNLGGLELANYSLAGVDCSGCDFRPVASIESCILDGAILRGADFSGMLLLSVSISGANCNGANFSGSQFGVRWTNPPDLTGINLSNAVIDVYLSGACLDHAILDGMDLGDGNDLTGSSFVGCDFRQVKGNLSATGMTQTNLSDTNFSGMTLTNQSLWKANLSGADFSKSGLAGIMLEQANLSDAVFCGANLKGASLKGADLSRTDFTGANLSKADLTGANLAGTNFTDAILTGTIFPQPVNGSNDPDARTIFAGATVTYAAIGLDWSCLDLTGATIAGLPTDLTGLRAAGLRWEGGSFKGLTLDGGDFTGAVLSNVVFMGASLRYVKFNGAVLTGADFNRAVLVGTHFRGAALGGVAQNVGTKLNQAYISLCDFASANLYGADFTGATLFGGNDFRSAANLQEANFANAFLPATDFSGANLKGASFDGACLIGARLTGADLSPATDGALSTSLSGACLQGVDFTGTRLDGADLANAVVTDQSGAMPVRYRDSSGEWSPPSPLSWAATAWPAASSLSDQTLCPNGDYYGNAKGTLTIAEMMTTPNPMTSWPSQAVED